MDTVLLAKVGSTSVEQGLMNQGLAFYNAGSRCAANISLTPCKTNVPMAPAIVCYAFAAELFIKLLLVATKGTTAKVHGLKDLYEALPEDARSKLSERYSKSAPKKLESDVAAVNSAFVDWRYLHEQSTISMNPQVVVNIAKAAYLVCRDVRPDIKVVGENTL